MEKVLIYGVRVYNIFSMYIISSFSHSVAREVKGVISVLKIWKVRLSMTKFSILRDSVEELVLSPNPLIPYLVPFYHAT